MDILKYFYEEPASLEILTPDLDPDARQQALPTRPVGAWFDAPRFYRGYLAGTNLDTGHVGLTALAHPNAFVDPLLDVAGARSWLCSTPEGHVEPVEGQQIPHLLKAPIGVAALACAEGPVSHEDLGAVAQAERRYGTPALQRLLGAPSCLVFLPEPAHHGHDWSFFAGQPMRDTLVAALRRHPLDGVRRFVAPFQKSRSEHKFYFETWQLGRPLPGYIMEV